MHILCNAISDAISLSFERARLDLQLPEAKRTDKMLWPDAKHKISVIQWALTLRVVPTLTIKGQQDERFVDLVTLDAEYRISVINAVVHFGKPATPILIRLLRSPSPEQRKLAVIILGIDALPVVERLLKSRDCGDVQLGITILGDMDPVVAKAYVTELKNLAVCTAN